MTVEPRPIVMPKLGLTMSEGMLAEWLVREGDDVAAGQPLFVVETDKISHDIEAADAGRIVSLLTKPGDTVAVGAVVATWTGPGQASHEPRPPAHGPAVAAAREPSQQAPRHIATPLARRLAASAGIDLATIAPASGHQRIKARDIHAAVAASRQAGELPAPMQATASPPVVTTAPNMRRLIAERMVRSKREIPHFVVTARADTGRLESLRRDLNGSDGRIKLTITHFLVAAMGRAMAAHRQMNAVWRDGEIVTLPNIAVGVAVETENGVRMPVIEDTDHAPLDLIANRMNQAAERARAGRLKASDMGDAAISLSNAGMFGVSALVPIIDPDQSFILGVGKDEMVFRPDADGSPRARREITLTLAADHRLVDGAAGARVLRAILERIEAPLDLLRVP
jgi:pyruvate dehydrogenase E2 component (dihydrolipoamide acetyltransferase)